MNTRTLVIVEKVPGESFAFGGPTFEVGQVVYEYNGPTYGTIRHPEVAVSLVPDQTPFYGIPGDAVEDLTHLPQLLENGAPTDYARCDIDGGLLAINSGRANCVRCLLNWADEDHGDAEDGESE